MQALAISAASGLDDEERGFRNLLRVQRPGALRAFCYVWERLARMLLLRRERQTYQDLWLATCEKTSVLPDLRLGPSVTQAAWRRASERRGLTYLNLLD